MGHRLAAAMRSGPSPGSQVNLLPAPSRPPEGRWHPAGFVTGHSCGAATDSHRLPYSDRRQPAAMLPRPHGTMQLSPNICTTPRRPPQEPRAPAGASPSRPEPPAYEVAAHLSPERAAEPCHRRKPVDRGPSTAHISPYRRPIRGAPRSERRLGRQAPPPTLRPARTHPRAQSHALPRAPRPPAASAPRCRTSPPRRRLRSSRPRLQAGDLSPG